MGRLLARPLSLQPQLKVMLMVILSGEQEASSFHQQVRRAGGYLHKFPRQVLRRSLGKVCAKLIFNDPDYYGHAQVGLSMGCVDDE